MLIQINDTIINMENIVEVTHSQVNDDIEELVFYNSKGLRQAAFKVEKIDAELIWNSLLTVTAYKFNVKTLP